MSTEASGNSDQRQGAGWRSSPGLAVACGGVLLWAAFPPLGWLPLVWVAPWPWLRVIAAPTLSGTRPYRSVFLGSWATWLLWVHWVRLPHWTAWFGWWVLAAYLAIYLVLFIGLSRVLVHAVRWPLPLAVAAVWTGLELTRGYLFTGLSLLLLGHALADYPLLIQVADLGGAYLVSGLVMLVSALVYCGICSPTRRTRWLLWASFVLAAQLGYGWFRLESLPPPSASSRQPLDVALIQGSIDTTFDDTSDPWAARDAYWQLTRTAVASSTPELIIWPESMFVSFVEVEQPVEVPAEFDLPPETYRQDLDRAARQSRQILTVFASEFETSASAILGGATLSFHPAGTKQFNTALLLGPDGNVDGRYHKMHPVMFGEYVPFGSWLPWLYRLTPMSRGLDAGDHPVAFEVEGWILCPAVCFENIVPHLIRRQILELQAVGKPPDVLVTITNDGWFWGSSLLDHHLACGVFRSVEHHLPMLIAANTGFSAVVAPSGQVVQRGPRRAEGVLRAQVSSGPSGPTLYQRIGDWGLFVCVLICGYAAFRGCVRPA